MDSVVDSSLAPYFTWEEWQGLAKAMVVRKAEASDGSTSARDTAVGGIPVLSGSGGLSVGLTSGIPDNELEEITNFFHEAGTLIWFSEVKSHGRI